MKGQVWAFSFVRDEEEIIEPVIRQLFAEGIDGMVVSDGGSTDGTLKILARLAKEFNLLAISDTAPAFYYYQGVRATQLANTLHDLGAEWIIPFDADELFCSAAGQSVADCLRGETRDVVSIRMKNYFATELDDANDPNPVTREQWRKPEANPLNKVCFRWQPGIQVADGNHHVSLGGQWLKESVTDSIVIGHYQNRTPQHFIRKIRREAANQVEGESERHRTGHWWRFGNLTDVQITEIWMREYFFLDPAGAGLVHDPAPYREQVKA